MTLSVTALAYLGSAVMIGAPLTAILAGPDEWAAPASAERRERWLVASCLTAEAFGICLQILAALRARVDRGNTPLWSDSVFLAIIAVLALAATICLALVAWVLRRKSPAAAN